MKIASVLNMLEGGVLTIVRYKEGILKDERVCTLGVILDDLTFKPAPDISLYPHELEFIANELESLES